MKRYVITALTLLLSCIYLDNVTQPSSVTIGEQFSITVTGTYDGGSDNAWLAMMLPIGIRVDSVVYLTTDTVAGVMTQIDTLLCAYLETIYSCDSLMCWQGFTTNYLSLDSFGAYTATVYAAVTDSTKSRTYQIDYLVGLGYEYYTVYDSTFDQPMVVNESAVSEHVASNVNTRLVVSPSIFRDGTTITVNGSNPDISTSMENSSGYQQPAIHIYDVSGRMVKYFDLTLDALRPTHVTWSGTDQCGYQLPNGIYLIKLTINDYSETKKVLLMK